MAGRGEVTDAPPRYLYSSMVGGGSGPTVRAVKDALGEYADRLFVSSITAFEIAIKSRSGKLELPMAAHDWYERALRHHGLTEVPVDGAIVAGSVDLPPLHNDPCDRIIIATAIRHKMAVVTCDSSIAQYQTARVIW